MAEPGGPTNQTGVFYQNSVAAKYLGELVSLEPTSPRETVVEVRIEAPAHVDDIVVRYADGHRDWVQVKVSLSRSGQAWTDLWQSFSSQSRSANFGLDDRLIVAMGQRNELSERLQGLIQRASTSEDGEEFAGRLSGELGKTFRGIEAALPKDICAFGLLKATEIHIETQSDIDLWLARLDLGCVTPAPHALGSRLRDLAGEAARVRGIFRASPLRQKLSENFGPDFFEPKEWGLAAYRQTLIRSARIEVPGRSISAPVQDLVVWPRVRRRAAIPEQDFDDETPRWDPSQNLSDVDLSRFPQSDLSRCILIAGPGMGKSTLVVALMARLANSPLVPVEVPLGAFAATAQTVIEFLEGSVNRDFAVRVDWKRLAEHGLISIFFDGLDEVPTAQRSAILKKISLFASRFPDVSWLLTVRDPAALNGPLDGELLELELFDNPEISDLVSKYKSWSPRLDEWTFTNNLAAYPDLARLARIPLFLSIILACWSPDAALPKKRSDVIESYLNTLFDPDRHQGYNTPSLSGTELRSIAQALAFKSLEREEIGLSRRQANQIIPLFTDRPSDTVMSQLERCGVMRAGNDGRLHFPYPIIQEYLAAAHLIDTAADQVLGRIGDVVKRPWAQVMQFALELLPNSTPHIRALLDARDDAFSTRLRLIGRCIANGAVVDCPLRFEVGSRLAELWGEAHYDLRERVGRLIVDAYATPLHPEVRRRLGWYWVLGSGAGEIISRMADPLLTSAIVDELLAGTLTMFMNLHGFTSALQDIAPAVATKVAARACLPETTEEEFDGLSSFLAQIKVEGDAARSLLDLASNAERPFRLRLAAMGAIADPLDERSLVMAIEGLGKDWKEQSAALKVFGRSSELAETIGAVLTNVDVSPDAKDYLAERLSETVCDARERGEVARKILARPGLADRHADILRVYLLRSGDRQTMLEMIERLAELPSDTARAVLVSLNHFPDRAIGLRALDKVRARSDSPSDIPGIAGITFIGLTCAIRDDGFDHFGMYETSPHPSMEAWPPMFDRWLATPGLTKVERLRLLGGLLKFRPELISEIRDIVFSATNPDASEWDEDEQGHDLRHGLDDLRRMRVDVPLDLAETFVLARRANLAFAGLAVFATQSSREALDRLLKLYERIEPKRRADLLSCIEIVAGRLGVEIWEDPLTAALKIASTSELPMP